jgi:pyruvate formate lyase activating enzyme
MPKNGDNIKGICFDIQRFSLHDGPGVRMGVFLKGCPLSCAWCHNPESQTKKPEVVFFEDRCAGCKACVDACPNKKDGDSPKPDPESCTGCGKCVDACVSDARRLLGEKISVADLVAKIEREREFFEQSGGGVTFTGGEPLSQGEFLLACLRALRDRCIHTAVDTCGYAKKELILEVAKSTDLFLFDLKIMDEAAHRKYTGSPVTGILENLRAVDASGTETWIRLPLVPGINDDDANIEAIGKFIASLENTRRIYILPFHKLGSHKYRREGRRFACEGIEPPAAEVIDRVAKKLAQLGLQAHKFD